MKIERCCVVFLLAFGALLAAADETDSPLYQERYRPQFHFTADKGWINDPNGLVYVQGVYHLFFQHVKPETRWGHATSTDLLHWKQHEDAIVPLDGHRVFSGSAAIDEHNSSGLQTGASPPVVALFTSWGQGQCLAYSNDAGMTWTRYENNPVLRLPGDALKSWPLSPRDPHISWDKQHKRWLMALYNNPDQREDKVGSGFTLFSSPDLKSWTKQSHLEGFYVCPDIFELPVEGEAGATSWVAMDWSQYATGAFDGVTFTPQSSMRKLDFGKNLSANQSWKNLPDKRVIQLCWLRGGKYPGMPFTQQLSFPTELSLRRINGELRLCKQPIREIKALYRAQRSIQDIRLSQGEETAFDLPVQSYDLAMELSLEKDAALTISVLGATITLEQHRIRALGCTGDLVEALSELRILADRTSIEIFANHGELSMSFCLIPPDTVTKVALKATENSVAIKNAVLSEVGSIWN